MSSDIKKGTTQIVKQSTKALATKGPKAAAKVCAAINPMEVIRDVVKAYGDWKKVKYENEVKRSKIKSWEKVSLEKIRVQRDIFMTYLDLSFDERRGNFKSYFKVLDRAVKKQEIQIVTETLSAIVKLAESNPFKDLSSVTNFRKTLKDRNQGIDI